MITGCFAAAASDQTTTSMPARVTLVSAAFAAPPQRSADTARSAKLRIATCPLQNLRGRDASEAPLPRLWEDLIGAGAFRLGVAVPPALPTRYHSPYPIGPGGSMSHTIREKTKLLHRVRR